MIRTPPGITKRVVRKTSATQVPPSGESETNQVGHPVSEMEASLSDNSNSDEDPVVLNSQADNPVDRPTTRPPKTPRTYTTTALDDLSPDPNEELSEYEPAKKRKKTQPTTTQKRPRRTVTRTPATPATPATPGLTSDEIAMLREALPTLYQLDETLQDLRITQQTSLDSLASKMEELFPPARLAPPPPMPQRIVSVLGGPLLPRHKTPGSPLWGCLLVHPLPLQTSSVFGHGWMKHNLPRSPPAPSRSTTSRNFSATPKSGANLRQTLPLSRSTSTQADRKWFLNRNS